MWRIKLSFWTIFVWFFLDYPAVFGQELRVAVKQVTSQQNDEYICETLEVKEESIFVNNFKPDLNSSIVHRVLIYGCMATEMKTRRGCYQPCHWTPSGSGSRLIYAWANGVPELQLPTDVSFHLGTNTGWKYLVIQVNYPMKFSGADSSGVVLSYRTEKTKYRAGIYTFASSLFSIEPRKKDVRQVLQCKLNASSPIYAFGLRVHSHRLGKAIGVFAKNGTKWLTIGEHSPRRPQTFYPLPAIVQLDNDVDLAARCVFDSSNENRKVVRGGTMADEMCNAYLLFYTEDTSSTYLTCDTPAPKPLRLPSPDKTELEFIGEVFSHGARPYKLPTVDGVANIHHQMDSSLSWKFEIHRDDNWTSYMAADTMPRIGQVGGVSMDDDGNLYVFHRGPRIWDANTFNLGQYTRRQEGPIIENAVVVIAPNGTVIDQWGSAMFYLPHGITVCSKTNSIWLTDVALHQVFKYDLSAVVNRPDKTKFDIEPSLTVGEAFKSGMRGKNFLCQPAAVATLPGGSGVIADGYCNSRLLIVSPGGRNMTLFLVDKDKAAMVVHAVVFDPSTALIFAADRENGRVFAVREDTFSIFYVLTPSPVPTRIYGLAVYRPPAINSRRRDHDQSLIIAFNQSSSAERKPSAFFFIDPVEQKVLDVVSLETEDDNGHAIVADSSNSWVFIGQIRQNWSPEGLLRFHAAPITKEAMTQTHGTTTKSIEIEINDPETFEMGVLESEMLAAGRTTTTTEEMVESDSTTIETPPSPSSSSDDEDKPAIMTSVDDAKSWRISASFIVMMLIGAFVCVLAILATRHYNILPRIIGRLTGFGGGGGTSARYSLLLNND